MKFAVAVTGLLAVAVACSMQDGTTGVTSSALIPPTADGGSSTRPTTTTGPSTTSYTQGAFQLAPGGMSGSVVAAGDASPWLLASDGYVYHYNNDCAPPRGWVHELFSASTTSLAVSPEGTPWRVDSNGYVYKRSGSNTCITANNSWTPMQAGFSAWEIGVGRSDAAWAIGRSNCVAGNCPIYQWVPGSQTWQQLSSGAARHIAVAPDGTVYVSNNSGTLYKWNGTSWVSWGDVKPENWPTDYALMYGGMYVAQEQVFGS